MCCIEDETTCWKKNIIFFYFILKLVEKISYLLSGITYFKLLKSIKH